MREAVTIEATPRADEVVITLEIDADWTAKRVLHSAQRTTLEAQA